MAQTKDDTETITSDEATEDLAENGDAKDADDDAAVAEGVPEKKAETSQPARKPLGAKEVIPFAWKLVGTAHHATVTLFKSVEKADVEAQYERVRKEGYYTDLRILDIDTKVVQPKPARKSRSTSATKAASKSSAAGSTKRKTAPKKKKKETASKKKNKKAAKKSAAPKKQATSKTSRATKKSTKKKKKTIKKKK